jgi:hypothetical protein
MHTPLMRRKEVKNPFVMCIGKWIKMMLWVKYTTLTPPIPACPHAE